MAKITDAESQSPARVSAILNGTFMAAGPTSNSNYGNLRIGKYQVQTHIATGGMGVVYKALDPERGREVALKVLSPELASKPDKIERFRSEARQGMRLRHKHLVTLLEWGEENGVYFLVLEFVDGINLLEYTFRKGKLDPQESCKIMRQAARVLDYLHREGVVHRDIKPANFLVTRVNGKLHIKLTDLGLAREVDDHEFQVTRDGTTVGTVDYMAPEQARNSRSADIRSDLYSLGCTWFHLLAGKPPFAEGGIVERIYKQLENEPPDIRQINPGVTEEMLAVLQKLLAKRQEQRYQTPAELLADLLRIKRKERTGTGRETPFQEGTLIIPPPEPKQTAEMSVPPDLGLKIPPSRSSGSHRALKEEPKEDAKARKTKPASSPATPALPPKTSEAGRSTQEMVSANQESSLLPAPNPEQQRAAQGQFERAKQVLSEGNNDYAIHLLLSCCKLDPGKLSYRKILRHAEKSKFGNRRRGVRFFWLATLAARARLKSAKRSQDHRKVLDSGEEILTRNPWDTSTQMDMAEAADSLGLLNLAIWLLEEAREPHPKHLGLNRALARLYEKRGNFAHASQLWESVRKIDPADFEAVQKLTDLAARDTIARGKYQEKIEEQDLQEDRNPEWH